MPKHVGEMQDALAALDDQVRMDGEHPSISIIVCKSRHKTRVLYALRESNKPIDMATYRITSTVPAEPQGELPFPELLEGIK